MGILGQLRRLAGRDAPVGWRIAAPFVYSLELGCRKDGGVHYPLDLAAWRGILGRLAPYAREVFLEGEEPLDHPEAMALLAACDEAGFRYHLVSHGAWREPRSVVSALRAWKRFGTLRLHVPDGEARVRQQANLAFAVAAGLEVWALLRLDTAEGERLPGLVAGLHDLGCKGVAVFRGEAAETEKLQQAFDLLSGLHRAGYNLVLEDCPPAGVSTRLPGRCRGLLASGVVDALGQVRACRHSPIVLGNLLESGMEAIWQAPQAASLRARLEDKPGPLPALYRAGCPFEAAARGGIGQDGAEPPAARMALDPALVPVPLFRLRQQPFGAVLIKGYDFVPLSRAGLRIAREFDGRQSLLQLRRRFGERAVLLAYALFCEKMLRFSREREAAVPGEEKQP